jgi:hypothetical protein
MKHWGASLKRPKNHDNLHLQAFRFWLEQYWQQSLVAEELDNCWLAVMVQQSPPLCIKHPFIYTVGAVETVGFLWWANSYKTRKYGASCRSH